MGIVALVVVAAFGYLAAILLLVHKDNEWREVDGPRPWDDDAD